MSKKSLFSIFLTLLLFIHFCFSQIESYSVAVAWFNWIHDVRWKLQQDIFIMEVIKLGNCFISYRGAVGKWINIVESSWLISLLSLVQNPSDVLFRRGLPWVNQDSKVFVSRFLNSSFYSFSNPLVGWDSSHHGVFFHSYQIIDCTVGNIMLRDFSICPCRMLNGSYFSNHSVLEPSMENLISLLEIISWHNDSWGSGSTCGPNVLEKFFECCLLGFEFPFMFSGHFLISLLSCSNVSLMSFLGNESCFLCSSFSIFFCFFGSFLVFLLIFLSFLFLFLSLFLSFFNVSKSFFSSLFG